jgi:RNA-binding motif X-linked protein 2
MRVALIDGGQASDSDASSVVSIDPEDPMRDYILAQRKEDKALKKSKKAKKSKKSKTSKKRRIDDDRR